MKRPMPIEREVGALQARMETVEAQVLTMSHDVREIRDAIVTARGGWKTLTLVIGFSVSLGAMIGKLLPFLAAPRP
jgi:chromosome condensin MukBEF ATPase and DNA-binding subunit MukB